MDGYKEAEKLDVAINKLVGKYPPTKDNAIEWLKFTRTVVTGLKIMNLEALKILRK